jgi:hypothetical protein
LSPTTMNPAQPEEGLSMTRLYIQWEYKSAIILQSN